MWRAFLVVVAAGGCLAPTGERGTPLYTARASLVPTSEVATLDFRQESTSPVGLFRTGPLIQSVDGRNVSTLIAPFELLPGCHIVDAGNVVFLINMRAGHEYTVQRNPQLGSRRLLESVYVHAIDRDPSGHVEEIPPATTSADLELCHAPTSPPS